MNIQIISKRCRQSVTRHAISFAYKDDSGCGYSFECTPEGIMLSDNHLTKQSYQGVLKMVEAGELIGPMRETSISSWIEPAVGKCHCGEAVVLSDPLDNECEKCHRWYNMIGQEVISPNSALGREARADDDRYADNY